MLSMTSEASLDKPRDDPEYEIILDRSPTAVTFLDGAGLIVRVNGRTEDLTGHSGDTLVGSVYADFVHADDRRALNGALAGLSDGTPLPSSVLLYRFRHAQGRWLHLESHSAVVHASDGRELLLLGSRDVSERVRAENFLRMITTAVEHIDEPVVITDRDGTIEFVNHAFERVTGYGREEAIGRNPRFLKSGRHDRAHYKRLWEIIMAGDSYHGVVINRRKDGTIYYEEKTITPIRDDSGTITHHIATGMDITSRRLAQERLAQSAERFALSLRGANEGIWDWDFRTGKVYFSSRWKEMLGFGDEEVGSDPEAWFALVHPDDLPELKTQLRDHMAGTSQHFEHEYRIRTKKGSFAWVLVRGLAVRDQEGKAYRIAGSQMEITDRKMIEEQLQHDALHDPLTGLPNRALFGDRLNHALLKATRHGDYRFAVLFMDMDRFKVVNDSLGHISGDHLLIEFSHRLLGCMRPSDTLARMGGDEFAVLLEAITDASAAVQFANRLEAQLKSPFQIQDHKVFSSVSIGIALYDARYRYADELIRDADTAMYHAKNRGRGRYVVFDAGMHSQAVGVLEMESDLRRAMDQNQFRVFYQPIVDLVSGQTAGFEALARWVHPQKGMILPGEFIRLAEETELIHAIGLSILRQSCFHLKSLQSRFQRRPPLTMSVNLSGVQFFRPELLNQIDLLLREFGLDPRTLKLEITESVIIEHADYAEGMMAQLRAQNIRLIIDDFGTGYSSMSNLKRYPIDTVKIDQSFVRKMCGDGESLEIVKATVNMAHNLKMEVIAEGVEDAAQLALLRSMGCEYGQGFYFSKPMEAELTERFLAHQRKW